MKTPEDTNNGWGQLTKGAPLAVPTAAIIVTLIDEFTLKEPVRSEVTITTRKQT